MRISKKIDRISSVGKIEYIIESVSGISKERVEAAVMGIKKDDSIDGLLRVFAILNIYFAGEEEDLMEDELSHNENYANKDNGKYSTAYMGLQDIKHSVFGLYQVMNAFTPKKKPSYYYHTDTQDIEFRLDHSVIGNLPCEGYIFPEKSPRQIRLIAEVLGFLNYLEKNLERCKKIVEDEERIGKNDEQCLVRLEKQIDKIYNYVKGKKKPANCEEYIDDLIYAEDNPGNVRKWFHKLKPEQLVNVALGHKEKLLAPFSKNERKAFDDDVNKLYNFRRVMKVVKEKCGKITGELMVYIQIYSDCTASNSAFHSCFMDTYSTIGGTQNIITYPGFNKAYGVYNNPNAPEYIEFQSKMDRYMVAV